MKYNQKNTPEWYWIRGLHDAKIISAIINESDWNPINENLMLKMNCHGAMYEQDIDEISFYDIKFLTEGFDETLLNGSWWIADELTENDDIYVLKLDFDTADCIRETVQFTFKRAKVSRKK